MATGAVLGDVFAAPGAASILHAIRALGQNNTGRPKGSKKSSLFISQNNEEKSIKTLTKLHCYI